MIRNTKLLGFALSAVLALMGGAASHAAADFHFETTPATIKGAQTATNVFTVNATEFGCSTATFAATALGTTQSALTFTPVYEGCTFGGFAGTTINMNGCKYVLHAAGEMDLGCSGANEMVVISKIAGVTKCTIRYPDQEGLASVGFSNEGSGTGRTITMAASVAGLSYSQTAGIGAGACKTEMNQSNGTYSGSVRFSATNNEGFANGLWHS